MFIPHSPCDVNGCTLIHVNGKYKLNILIIITAEQQTKYVPLFDPLVFNIIFIITREKD